MATLIMYLAVSFIVVPAFLWLTCSNNGWLLFLGLSSVVASIFFIFFLLGIDIEIHEWLFYPVVSLPWVGMIIYQSYFTYKKVKARANSKKGET